MFHGYSCCSCGGECSGMGQCDACKGTLCFLCAEAIGSEKDRAVFCPACLPVFPIQLGDIEVVGLTLAVMDPFQNHAPLLTGFSVGDKVWCPRSSGVQQHAVVSEVNGTKAFCTWKAPGNRQSLYRRGDCLSHADTEIFGKWVDFSSLSHAF